MLRALRAFFARMMPALRRRPSVLSVLAAAVAMAGTAVQAQAQAAAATCPATPFVADPTADGVAATRQRLADLAPLAEACDLRADYHALRGALLLALGRVAEAATALEKALLLNPTLAGAQLDYAQALGRLGQGSAARELAGQVAQRPDAPPGLLGWLRDALAQPVVPATKVTDVAADAANPAPAHTWRWSAVAQAGAGRESNLKSATYTSSLTLLLPGGPVDVSLAESERPVAGLAARSLLALQGERAAGPGRLRLGLLADARVAQPEAVPAQTQLRAHVAWSGPLGLGALSTAGQVHAAAGLVRFNPSGANPYRDHSWSLLYEPATQPLAGGAPFLGRCLALGGLASVYQRLPATPVLDGRYLQVRTELSCVHGAAGPAGPGAVAPASTQLVLATGRDRPNDAERPGGAKQRADVQLRHERALAWPGAQPTRLAVWARVAQSRDAADYSPLLPVGRVQTHRLDWGVGHWWPLGGGLSAGVEWETVAQQSNNPLLRVRSQSVYALLRWSGDLK